MINESIRHLRERLGLSQAELARKAGMKKPQLCVLEKGSYRPRAGTLERLARALGTTTAELRRVDATLSVPSPLVPLVRTTADCGRARAAAERVAERVGAALDARGVTAATTLPLVHAFVREPHGMAFLAQALRASLGVGRAAFTDLAWHLELANVRILRERLPDGVPSLGWWEPGRRALVIVLRSGDTAERQLYRLACEIGTACLFRSDGDRPLRLSKKDDRLVRSFAAEFLMPAATVAEMTAKLAIRKGAWTMPRLCLFKAHFGVSAEAFAFRLEELGLIERKLRHELRAELRAYYKAHPKAMEPAPTRPALTIDRRWKMMEDE